VCAQCNHWNWRRALPVAAAVSLQTSAIDLFD
jgi:hypothetical protein